MYNPQRQTVPYGILHFLRHHARDSIRQRDDAVPIGPLVLVEAKVKPTDVGFLRVGQHATVKLSGYEYNLYGGLEGKIEYISPDALGESEKPGGEGRYYRAMVRADRNTLRYKGETLPVVLFNYMKFDLDGAIAAASMVSILLALAVVLVLERLIGLKAYVKL